MATSPPFDSKRYHSQHPGKQRRRKEMEVPNPPDPTSFYSLQAAQEHIQRSSLNLSQLPTDTFGHSNTPLEREFGHQDLPLRQGGFRQKALSYREGDGETSTLRDSVEGEDNFSDHSSNMVAATERVDSRSMSPFSDDASVKTSKSQRLARREEAKQDYENGRKTNTLAHKRDRAEHRAGIYKARLEEAILKAKIMKWNKKLKKYPDLLKHLGIELSDSA